MAAPDTTGHPVPVALIAHRFGYQFSACATGALNFTMADGDMSPLDVFADDWATTDAGHAIVILNSLTTPLTVVDARVNSYNQYSYPAITNPQTSDVIKTHQIPAARAYPRPSKHPAGAVIGGLGSYRFTFGSGTNAGIGLAFSTSEDGSSQDPLVAVAISNSVNAQCWAVTDLNREDFSNVPGGDSANNLENLFWLSRQKAARSCSASSTTGNQVSVYARYAPTAPGAGTGKDSQMEVLMVWVRDKDSTFAV